MLVSHEVPLWLQNQSGLFNDYDYALVHLLEKSPEYAAYFMRAKERSRFIILDNSLYELGEAFDEEIYKDWIKKLRPSIFIAPDKFGDAEFTIDKARQWKEFSKEVEIPMMVATHGSTIDEMIWCYRHIKDIADIIGISFASPAYNGIDLNQSLSRMYGRIAFITELENQDVLCRNKPHHLLGLALPQELLYYKDKTWIYSIDSSNPVALGLEGNSYKPYGLSDKPSTIINNVFFDLMPGSDIVDKIQSNIKTFKKRFIS